MFKTAEAAAQGRVVPEVIQWARHRRGWAANPDSNRDVAATLLDAIRKEKFFIPDPVDAELIVNPKCMLASCDGIELDGGDCDDHAAALAAALEAIGIVCCIIGQAFDGDHNITHVLVGVEVEPGVWLYADSTEDFPLGQANACTHEYWMSIPGGQVLCDADACMTQMQGQVSRPVEREFGDMVTIGLDETGELGDPNGSTDAGSSVSASTVWWSVFSAGVGLAAGYLLFSRR